MLEPIALGLGRLAQISLGLLAGLGGGYLGILAGATFLGRDGSGARPDGSSSAPTRDEVRFAVVVPAHDEEEVMPAVLKSLEGLRYPKQLYEVFVIADNCRDATAEVARRHDCTVWERVDPDRRSKGYALGWAFDKVPETYDAVVVVDADSVVDPGLLAAFSRAYDPSTVLQGSYLTPLGSGVLSVAGYVAAALHNDLKPRGREALGCSAGVLGNGICIPRAVLDEVPWRRFGLAEDVEYHVDLVLAGIRVGFVPQARVSAAAPGTIGGMDSQRSRWERGRLDALRSSAWSLLRRAVGERDPVSLEVLASISALPFSPAVLAAVGCTVLGVLRRSKGGTATGVLALAAASGATLRALRLVRAPAGVYAYLAALPLFMLWKGYVTLSSLFGGSARGWVRTERSRREEG